MTQPSGYPEQHYDPYGHAGQGPSQQPGPWTAHPYAQPHAQPETGYPHYPQQNTAPQQQYPQQPYFTPTEPVFPPSPPQRGKTLLIGFAVVACLLVLGGGGTAAYLAFGRSEGTGAADPSQAVDQFLTAVYQDKDLSTAEAIVCRSARDSDAIASRVEELRTFELEYKSPVYTWDQPTIEAQESDTATVNATVKLTTSDDRTSEQALEFLTVKADGWLVCEINAA